jgi:ATP-binding cassette subfamily C protein CydD
MRPVDPRLLRYAAAARAFFVAGGLFGLLQTVAVVGFSYAVTQLVVRAIAGDGLDGLLMPFVLLGASVALRFVATWAADINAVRGAAVVKSELRRGVVLAATRLGPSWLAGRNTATVGTTIGPGLDALDAYFAKFLPQLILTAVATPLIVIVIWAQDWLSGLVVTITLPLIPLFMVLIGWATQAVQTRQWERLQRLSTAFLDVVGGLSTLKIYGRQHRQSAHIRAVADDYRVQTMTVLRISFLSGFALELAASLAVALVAVSIGVRLIDGSLALGVGLFVLLLAPEVFLPVRNVGAQFHASAAGLAAAGDVFDVLDAAEGEPRSGGGMDDRGEAFRGRDDEEVDVKTTAARRASGSTVRMGGLEVCGLAVRYGERAALVGLSARFRAGSITAVTGPSGAGKTSLVRALVGFAPFEGRIALDGCAVEAGEMPHPWIAWSGQRAVLVPGTVLENVTLGDPRPLRVEARRVLDAMGGAGIALERTIDERGGLSGGQAQRVAAARAAYRASVLDCRVVVFDEPTSAVDERTEQLMIDGMRALADEGRVVIVVSHRAGVIAAADAVVSVAPEGGALDGALHAGAAAHGGVAVGAVHSVAVRASSSARGLW